MPVGAYEPVSFVPNGVTTVFPYNFRIISAAHLKIVIDGLTITSGYTVDGVGSSNGGNITFATAPTGSSGLITREVPYTRTEDYQPNGDFKESTVDNDFDLRQMQIQQLDDRVARTLRVAAGDEYPLELPAAADRADGALGFDADGGVHIYDPASAVTNADNINYSSGSAGAQSRPVSDQFLDFRSVMEFFSATQKADIRANTGLVDVADALVAALDCSIAERCSIVFPGGNYRCSHIVKPTAAGTFAIKGAGSRGATTYGGITNILGMHADDAVLSLRGCAGCRVEDINFFGGADANDNSPKTLLMLCRTIGGASAGWHTLRSLAFHGRCSVAGPFNVASEGNVCDDFFVNLASDATAGIGWYMGPADGTVTAWATETPIASTLLGQTINNASVYLLSDVAGASCMYLDGAESFGAISVNGCYFVQRNGHNVTIRNGQLDGKDTHGPIVFTGCGGEQPAVIDTPDAGDNTPLSGFNLIASAGAPVNLHGLVINGVNFHMNAGEFILQDAYVVLNGAQINGRGTVSPLTNPITFRSSTISPFGAGAGQNTFDCEINVDGTPLQQGVQAPTLAGDWSTAYAIANGYDIPGYFKDRDRFVHLVGAAGAGSAATMFTLPAGYRPANNMNFPVDTNTGVGSINVSAAGVVTLVAGGMDPVFFGGISFKAA